VLQNHFFASISRDSRVKLEVKQCFIYDSQQTKGEVPGVGKYSPNYAAVLG
jgi:hypothetical protein